MYVHMGINNRKWDMYNIDIIDLVWIIEAAVIISLTTLSLCQYYITRLCYIFSWFHWCISVEVQQYKSEYTSIGMSNPLPFALVNISSCKHT